MGDFRDCRNLFCGRDCEGRHRVGFANSQHRIDGSLAPCGTGGRYFNNSCDLNKHMAVVFGTALKLIVYRLWPLLVTLIFGSFVGAILISGVNTTIVTALLGGVLALFSISGLTGLKFTVPIEKEKKWNPVIGFITGSSPEHGNICSSCRPYLQSIDFSKGQSPPQKMASIQLGQAMKQRKKTPLFRL